MLLRKTLILLPVLSLTSGSAEQASHNSKEEAMDYCLEKVATGFEKAVLERELAKDNPELLDNLNPQHYDLEYSSLISNEYQEISLIQGLCMPTESKRFLSPNIIYVNGYIEYLVTPKNHPLIGMAEGSKVEKVWVRGANASFTYE